MLRSKKSLALVLATGALSFGASAAPASAAPLVVVGGGLVNVTVTDVLNDVTAQVPIGVAANICDVNAAVLVQEFRDSPTSSADCTATATSTATRGPGGARN